MRLFIRLLDICLTKLFGSDERSSIALYIVYYVSFKKDVKKEKESVRIKFDIRDSFKN